MTIKSLAAHYELLHPEERFKLILAASSRDDDADQERLTRAGFSYTLFMSDHCPYALAFLELSDMTFTQLLALSADYLEGILNYGRVSPKHGLKKHDDRCPLLDLLLARGYELNVRYDGWKLFCSRQELPPFHMWEARLGFERVQRAMRTSQKMAFVEQGYLSWQNAQRTPQLPLLTHVQLTSNTVADELEAFYRERLTWWKGSSFSHANH